MRSRIWFAAILLVVAACGGGSTATSKSTSPATTTVPTTVAPTTSTTEPAPTTSTTSTTSAPIGLSPSDQPWLVHTLSGVASADGDVVFETDPLLGDENLVRDREGGIFFSDASGLWWWRAGETEPELMLDGGFFRIIEAIPTDDGPVVHLADERDRYIEMATLTEVAALPGSVEITDDFSIIRTAANGLSATVTQPNVTLDFEGFPDQVIEPAHLIIRRGSETLLDLRIGGPVEAYARLHDFDGRNVIVSRGPYEPALPPETFFVIDLGCAECTTTFIEAAATAAFTGSDVDWDGAIEVPDASCTSWDPDYAGAPSAGLFDRAEATRSNLLRATAACDITGLQYELDFEANIVLSQLAINRFDPRTWLAVSPDLLGEIDTALRQPGRLVGDGYVFPAWFAVDSFDDLASDEQVAMTAVYGDDAPSFWSDFFSIATGTELSVTIGVDGLVTALERPLS